MPLNLPGPGLIEDFSTRLRIEVPPNPGGAGDELGGQAVTLFEADGRLGGHADTHEVVGVDGTLHCVDTGFVVHNRRTYPLLCRLFAELGVATQESEMSMSICCAEAGWSTRAGAGCPV